MQTARTIAQLRQRLAAARRAGHRVGFVPTMGNLHEGHYSLLRLAREHADCVVASVFVNPAQFGPNEDFARYPRSPDADAAGLQEAGCDLLFLPSVEEVYPYGVEQCVKISVPVVGATLEGALRPGHFDGVATVVGKLFNLVQADVAVFGQKDYQQLLVIRRLVRDLAFPLEIVAAPIVREAHGLAMSSRNQYLDAATRAKAGVIHATLLAMAEGVRNGDSHAAVESAAAAALAAAGLSPDYAVLRRAADLSQPDPGERTGLVALVAVRAGSTRLIDNTLIQPQS